MLAKKISPNKGQFKGTASFRQIKCQIINGFIYAEIVQYCANGAKTSCKIQLTEGQYRNIIE